MEASASQPSSETPKRLIVKDPFGGKNRSRKEFAEDAAAPSPSDLDSNLWSRLPEEMVLQIFARLPVKDILRLRSLNKTWRSSITSPHFQAAFEGASLVRIALMVHDAVDGTMFLTQEDGQECFRRGIARCPEVVSKTHIAATVNGLVCVIEHEKKARIPPPEMLEIRIFVMNVVTGFRRELPHPKDRPTLPSFVRMDKTASEAGGYTITFFYGVGPGGRRSWEVYDSVQNRWSRIVDEGALAFLKTREVFTMHCMWPSTSLYEKAAAFFTTTNCLRTFRLRYARGRKHIDVAHSLHDTSADAYVLGALGGQHGVWRRRLMRSDTWKLVCECPKPGTTWTHLRVMNDVVVLLVKLPYHDQPDAQQPSGFLPGEDVGTVVKVLHMPTKSWHSFPEKDSVVRNWGVSIRRDDAGPFLVEAKFDVEP